MAHPLGFYSKQGLNVEVVKTAGWALIRDKMLNKEHDASHFLSPMPIAISQGLGSVAQPMRVATALAADRYSPRHLKLAQQGYAEREVGRHDDADAPGDAVLEVGHLPARAADHQRRVRGQRPQHFFVAEYVDVAVEGERVRVAVGELFGRERGAYTGALSKQVGRFELASGSTIFLDEIGDLPPDVQAKLLRVLQQQEVRRVGATVSRKVDIRVVSAANRDMRREVAEGVPRRHDHRRRDRRAGKDIRRLRRELEPRRRCRRGRRLRPGEAGACEHTEREPGVLCGNAGLANRRHQGVE